MKTEKFRSTEVNDAPLEGSTIFLYRSSTSHTSLDSSGLAELKYAIFSRTASKTGKLWHWKLFLSTIFKHGLLEGSTISLYRSSTSRSPLDSSGLAELKYAFFSRTGRNTKKLQRSNLFQLTIFKHRLLEGSTILLQYSSISRTRFGSSLLGELKYAISAGYDVILKNKSIRKCKK